MPTPQAPIAQPCKASSDFSRLVCYWVPMFFKQAVTNICAFGAGYRDVGNLLFSFAWGG